MFRLAIPLVAGIFVSDHFFQGALPVLVFGMGILGCLIGLKGSPTKIARASDKVRKGAGEVVTLDPTEAAQYIVDKFKEKHVI